MKSITLLKQISEVTLSAEGFNDKCCCGNGSDSTWLAHVRTQSDWWEFTHEREKQRSNVWSSVRVCWPQKGGVVQMRNRHRGLRNRDVSARMTPQKPEIWLLWRPASPLLLKWPYQWHWGAALGLGAPWSVGCSGTTFKAKCWASFSTSDFSGSCGCSVTQVHFECTYTALSFELFASASQGWRNNGKPISHAQAHTVFILFVFQVSWYFKLTSVASHEHVLSDYGISIVLLFILSWFFLNGWVNLQPFRWIQASLEAENVVISTS